MACGFNLSGLRLFDIHDPAHPREIGYFNPRIPAGVPAVPYQAMSARKSLTPSDGQMNFPGGPY